MQFFMLETTCFQYVISNWKVLFLNGHFNFSTWKMTVPNWNKSFLNWKIQLLSWKMTTSDWSMIFSFCKMQCPVGGKTHIPVGNEIFELEVKRFIWNTNFYFENVIFQFENQVTLLENDNLQLEQYRSEGCARTAYFCSWARWEEGRFRIPVSVATRPDPTRPDPTGHFDRILPR